VEEAGEEGEAAGAADAGAAVLPLICLSRAGASCPLNVCNWGKSCSAVRSSDALLDVTLKWRREDKVLNAFATLEALRFGL
jgi:hypothetical protein